MYGPRFICRSILVDDQLMFPVTQRERDQEQCRNESQTQVKVGKCGNRWEYDWEGDNRVECYGHQARNFEAKKTVFGYHFASLTSLFEFNLSSNDLGLVG